MTRFVILSYPRNMSPSCPASHSLCSFDDGYLHTAIKHTDGLKAIVLELYGACVPMNSLLEEVLHS